MNNGDGSRPGPNSNQQNPPPNGRPGPPPPRGFTSGSYTQYQSNGTRPHNAVPYSPAEEEDIQRRLNKVLGPEYVSFRPGSGGQNVSYIEGWKALNLANDIFGFNGWSSELISVQVDFLDVAASGRVSLGLSVVVRITIRDGTFHEDFGYGFIENAKNKAMAFEKCKKEAFTDGLKRCLRCFGNVLGNCLYDRTIIAKMQKVKQPPRELEHNDFHRDPLVLNREHEKERQAAERRAREMRAIAPPPQANDTRPPQNPPMKPPPRPRDSTEFTTPTADKTKPAGPEVIKGSDLGDFDDLFQFSDDMPGDELNDRLDDYELELLKNKEEEQKASTDPPLKNEDAPAPTPSQVHFTSSKKALEVQNVPDQSAIPVYDHKFVASSVRRTVDPSRSVKVRRPNLPSAYSPSQINQSPTSDSCYIAGLGKRPVGMPPSKRQPLKKPRREDTDTEKPPSPENAS